MRKFFFNFVSFMVSSYRKHKADRSKCKCYIFHFISMRTGNPPDVFEVLLIFRVLRADYRVVLLRLVQVRWFRITEASGKDFDL